MRKNCGIIVGQSKEFIEKALFEVDNPLSNVLSKFSVKVFAEGDDGEGDSSNDEGSDDTSKNTTINYEDLISKARREEKDKQYKVIEKLKTQIVTLTEQHNKDLLKVADLEKKIEEVNKKLTTAGSGDSEEITGLKETIKNLEKEKETFEKKVKEYEENKPASREELEKEIRADFEKEYEVKTYKAEKMAELKDQILVPELVGGSTKEEIDISIQSALDRSKEIKKNLGLNEDGKHTNKRTPKSPTNPDTSRVQDKEYSLEYLANLDPASDEYKKVRKELGL